MYEMSKKRDARLSNGLTIYTHYTDLNKLVLDDFVQSPVGQVLKHHHRLVVTVDGGNGKYLVGTKSHYDANLTGRCDDHVGTVHISHTFREAASDGFLLVLMLIIIITSMLRRVESDYFEAIPERTVFESYLYFPTHTYTI